MPFLDYMRPRFLDRIGFSADAHHITDPHIEGAKRCIKLALKDADISPEEVDYINPHATATPVGDRNETQALLQIYKDTNKRPLISATKSMTGHLLGAAGAVEAIFSVMALKNGIIPPTINMDNPDPQCQGFDYVPFKPREANIRHVLSNSFGFGGTNASLVFKSFEG